jgi:YD repeat-containing protein
MTSTLRRALSTVLSTLAAVAVLGLPAASQAQTNVALAANGGVASASSNYGTGYPVAGVLNGDRKGLNWGSGGGWNDATSGSYPDWLQVTFNAAKTLNEIDVFTVQDTYTSPLAPTATMTFTKYGIVDFQVQTWNGGAWVTVPGGGVTGNNLVWRKFTFAPITTDRFRIYVTKALASYSRLTEVEAWAAAVTNSPPSISLTAPVNGSSLAAPATVNLAANASDVDGSVAKVEFYRNGSLIGTDTAAPYTFTDSNLAAGGYSYTARATDNAGAATTSPAANVTVTAAAQTLAVSLSGSGGGSVASSPAGINCGTACATAFANGTVVTLTATPTGAATFAGWAGACAGMAPTCAVTMNQAHAVDAAFAVPTQSTYQYDPNGNLIQLADPLGNLRQMSYDALDRPYLVKEPSATTVGATAGQIALAYDGQSQLAGVTDPRNLTTGYTLDGLGNVLTLTSPDTGTSTFTYDEAGNLKTRLDARNKLATYAYDALNRIHQIGYGDQTVTYTWDTCAQGIGRLCRIDDGSGNTVFGYDAQGRLTGQSQTMGTVTRTTGYTYNSAGQMIGQTTPAGQAIGYDWADGRITAIRVNGATLLSGLHYQPFGPVSGWTWGNGQTMVRSFDLAGRPRGFSLGIDPKTGAADSRGLGYDAAGRIRAVIAASDPILNQSHRYDGLDRLTGTQLGSPVTGHPRLRLRPQWQPDQPDPQWIEHHLHHPDHQQSPDRSHRRPGEVLRLRHRRQPDHGWRDGHLRLRQRRPADDGDDRRPGVVLCVQRPGPARQEDRPDRHHPLCLR